MSCQSYKYWTQAFLTACVSLMKSSKPLFVVYDLLLHNKYIFQQSLYFMIMWGKKSFLKKKKPHQKAGLLPGLTTSVLTSHKVSVSTNNGGWRNCGWAFRCRINRYVIRFVGEFIRAGRWCRWIRKNSHQSSCWLRHWPCSANFCYLPKTEYRAQIIKLSIAVS